MSDRTPLDEVNGFPIIAMFATRAYGEVLSGRIFIVDRGAEHVERYVVARQDYSATKLRWEGWWSQASYCRDLTQARGVFVQRIEQEPK